jgi:beta-D-xylosidase 4
MCSYNSVNGVPTCASSYFLQTILRDHWNWTAEQQWVTSDCDAVEDIWDTHNYTSSPEQAAADALNAGTGTFVISLKDLH